jgi:putative oxidoreductase
MDRRYQGRPAMQRKTTLDVYLNEANICRVTNNNRQIRAIPSMKTTLLLSRILLGLLFLVFGLNGFLHFIPMPPPSGLAGQYVGALFVSHYLSVVFALEAAAGLLLLVNRFVPLALTILAPILVNIALFHVCLAPSGYAPAVVAVALWLVLFVRERAAFAGLLAVKGTL